MTLKCTIAIRSDDPLMARLYQHLAALPTRRGKRYRARLVSQVLEVGSALLFGEGRAADEALVLAYRTCIPADLPPVASPSDAVGVMRLALVVPESGPTAPLYVRLQSIPDGQGKQGRARLLSQVIQAGVNVLYHGVVAVVTQAAPVLSQETKPSVPVSHSLPDEMLGFMDNLSMDGLE
jgi:hypothetical protein